MIMKSVIDTLVRWTPPGMPAFAPARYSDIEDLEEAAGGPMPGAYHDFLRTAGNGLGALEIGEAEFGLRYILERYAIVSWTPPMPLVFIGLDRAPLGTASYYLDRSRPWGSDDCAVLRFPLPVDDQRWEDLAWVDFVSLRELLLHWGFISLLARDVETQVLLRFRDPFLAGERREQVIAAIEHWPVARLPETEVCRVYEGESLAVLVKRDAETRELHTVRIVARDARELRIRAAMLEDLGMEAWPTRSAQP
jgi:hypothetical protein